MRGRSVLALGLVAGGVGLAAGGIQVFLVAAGLLWESLPLLLIGAGGLVLVVAAVPPSRLVAPAVLVSIGLGILVVRTGDIAPATLLRYGGAALAVVLGVALSIERGRPRTVELARRRLWVVLWLRTFRASTTPARVRLGVILGRATLDFRGAVYQDNVVELFLSVWCASAVLALPAEWLVVGGRVDAAAMVVFRGRLDSPEAFTDPAGDRQRATLQRMLTESGHQAVLVVHVLGAAGRVDIGLRV